MAIGSLPFATDLRSHFVATGYVSALDRSPLGTLAIDENLLIQVMESCLIPSDQVESAERHLDRLAVRACEAAGLSIQRVEAEILLWHSKFNTRLQGDVMTRVHVEWRDRLRLVLDSEAAFLPYFESGIWDVTTINSFISNDVDPELALSTVALSQGGS